jgi:uncharacterized protein YkwD
MKIFASYPAAARGLFRLKKSALRLIAADERLRRKSFNFFSRPAKIFFSCSIAVAVVSFVPAAAHAQGQALQRNDSERELFELLNRERAANHLPELQWDDALFKAARQHALLMLDLNILEHQLPGEPGLAERLTNAGARFIYIAENIATGKDSATIHSSWMHSPGHRANILSARVTAVGIAVVRGTSGLFAVEDFSQWFASVSLEQQEKQVASLLSAKGLHVTGVPDDARKACDANVGLPGARSGAVIRFESGDLSEFPPELEKKIRGEPYRNVAVGACHMREAAGFARYKIALLFF